MEQRDFWLCRNCNTKVAADLRRCPKCDAERGEEVAVESGEETTIVMDEPNAEEPKKAKYIFRESVLIYAADIGLILGVFCSFALLISPMFLSDKGQSITIISIVQGIGTFCFSLISWALLRSVAEISRMLRERERNIGSEEKI